MNASTRTAPDLRQMPATATLRSTVAPAPSSVHPMRNGQESEALAFLAERPLHTFVMTGHIRDNGLESSFNRGSFHACRNENGSLEGVALIGHATLVETRCEAALAALAHVAQSCSYLHMIMGEQEKIESFWKYYAATDQSPRRIGREVLCEQRWPVEERLAVKDLRLATRDDLEQVMLAQGEMAFAESGINPMEVDPEGFRRRCARRVEQKRVWIWMKDGQLIFKADVISDTPQVIYLEGIYVNPQDQGKGFGTRCMSQLSQTLLKRTDSLCLLVNEQNWRARDFFQQVGFTVQSYYKTIFL